MKGGTGMETTETQADISTQKLTNSQDWDAYYAGRQLAEIAKGADLLSWIDEILPEQPGKIFELGCGGSSLLIRLIKQGWNVGGIDFNQSGVALLKNFISTMNKDSSRIIFGDVFSHVLDTGINDYDVIISIGFLEHFKNPGTILKRWKSILKDDGLIISILPNLFSINAKILKKYDPEIWGQHIVYSLEDMDDFHAEADLVPVTNAHFFGDFDMHMLIPWGEIKKRVKSDIVFKSIKYITTYGVSNFLRLLPKRDMRTTNAFIVGVYSKRR